jgi:hypothetical protein
MHSPGHHVLIAVSRSEETPTLPALLHVGDIMRHGAGLPRVPATATLAHAVA